MISKLRPHFDIYLIMRRNPEKERRKSVFLIIDDVFMEIDISLENIFIY